MANALRWLEVASHDDVMVTWLEPSISFFAVVVFFVFGFSLFCFLCRDLLSRDSIKTKTKRFAGGGRHFFFVTVHFCLIFVGFWWSMDLLAARYVTFFFGGGFLSLGYFVVGGRGAVLLLWCAFCFVFVVCFFFTDLFNFMYFCSCFSFFFFRCLVVVVVVGGRVVYDTKSNSWLFSVFLWYSL